MTQIGQQCLKMAIRRYRWSKTVGTAWNEGGMGPKTLVWTTPNSFHLRSILFQLFWTTRILKLHFIGILGHFGRPRVKFWGTPLLQIAPKTSVWTSPNLFHLRSTLFQPFRTTGTLKLPFLGIFGQFGPIWAPLGHNWGRPAARNWSKNFGLDLS